MTDKPLTLAEMQARVNAWVDSPEGRKELAATAKAAREAGQKVLDDARVNPEDLRKVIGPLGTRPI
jgi:hypothetical protein